MTGSCALTSLRGVDPGDQPLGRRLLVAGGPVDLPGEKQAGHPVRLERRAQLGGLDEVVLDRVAGPHHHRAFEPGQRVHELLLNLRRETHRKPVHVDLVDVEPFGLEEDLVALAMREPHDLVFERRAVARTDPGDLAVEERRLVDVRAHEVVHASFV